MIHETAILHENVILGENVYIGPYCVIGFPPESKEYWGGDSEYSVVIGDNTIITGMVTIDAGTVRDTYIGPNCFLMKKIHAGHDVFIGHDVTIAPHALIGGHVTIHEFANIGMGAKIHQRCQIGSYSMVGMGAVVTKKTPIWPYGKFAGVPARHLGRNRTGEHLTGKEYWEIQQQWKSK